MMNRRLHIMTGFLVLMALVSSCMKDSFPVQMRPYAGKGQIQIRPTLDNDWVPVKSDWEPIEDISVLQSQDAGGFGVYALYTGSEEFDAGKQSSAYAKFGRVYDNRQFRYDPEALLWEDATGIDEYWPALTGEHLSFFAYAPYNAWRDSVHFDGTVPYVNYTMPADLTAASLQGQRDLLWGTNAAGYAHRDVTPADYEANDGIVDMHFHHALAKLHFTISGLESVTGAQQPTPGVITTDYALWGETQEGSPSRRVTFEEIGRTAGNVSYSGFLNYQATRTDVCTYRLTLTKQTTESQSRTGTESRTVTSVMTGKRYPVEEVSVRGLNRTGALLLDNRMAGEPEWSAVSAFPGPGADYVLDSDGALTESLKYVDASTLASAMDVYTGVSDTPTDLLSAYPLYVIPRDAGGDPVGVEVTYHALDIEGTLDIGQEREIEEERSRVRTDTWTKEVTVTETSTWSNWGGRAPDLASIDFDDPTWTQSDVDENSSFGWVYDQTNWTEWPTDGNLTSEGDWEDVSESLTGMVLGDIPTTLTGSIASNFEGGKSYTINLLLSGDRIELEVTPQPWEYSEQDFIFRNEKNRVIQHLTYEGESVDYADAAGHVYINNRTGHFYFQLDEGRYVEWQAILVGDSAFGFTDASGNFLRDGNGTLVSSLRGDIDRSEMNHIYVRALDDAASVTSRAKLRLYYIDVLGRAVAALDLVNADGVLEWTLVQNAN